MGRPKTEVDMDAALDLIERGEKIPAISTELGVSTVTLRNRVAELSKKQGLLLQYRTVQALQLTELQARVLEAITPEKIENAGLKDLVACYKILKEKEQVLDGKPTEIKSLVAHLIHIEKQEALALKGGEEEENIIDVDAEEYDVTLKTTVEEELDELSELDTDDF